MPRALPKGLGAKIDLEAWERLPVFDWLIRGAGLDQAEVLKTFNCGIGMIAIVDPEGANDIMAVLSAEGIDALRIGTVVKGDGVAYSGSL